MTRILLILEAEVDFQTRRCAEALARGLGSGFEVEVRRIGRGGDWRNLPAGLLALRRQRFDVIHAWGTRPLLLAGLGLKGAGASRIVYSPPADGAGRSLRWLRAVMAHREVRVICPTATLQMRHLRGGVDPDRCEVIRPGVDFSRLRRRRDTSLRAALGLAEDDFVLLPAGESTREAHHEEAVWAGSLVHELDERCKLLVWGRGDRAGAVAAFARKMRHAAMLREATARLGRAVEFEELLSAADMALWTGGDAAPTLPLAIAMASGAPIVATVTATSSELLEDHHTALLVPAGSPRLLAQRVMELRQDAALRWRLADRARAEAYDYCSLSRFLERYRAAVTNGSFPVILNGGEA